VVAGHGDVAVADKQLEFEPGSIRPFAFLDDLAAGHLLDPGRQFAAHEDMDSVARGVGLRVRPGPLDMLQPDRGQLPIFGDIVDIDLDDPVVSVVGQPAKTVERESCVRGVWGTGESRYRRAVG
jgi:hypothetical protein